MGEVIEHAKTEQLPQVVSDSGAIMQVISRAASDPNCDIDKMERLLAMHERMTASQAESAFNSSMSDAQSEMRPVSADANNPQTRSKYATYAKLDKALRPIYTSKGFALSFGTSADAPEGFVCVLCYVSHKSGHTRTYQILMPSDGKGAKGGDVMTKTHAVGAGVSYGCRYLLKMIFNVAVGEDDDDGNHESPTEKANRERIDAETRAKIEAKNSAIAACKTLAGKLRAAKDFDELTKLASMAPDIPNVSDNMLNNLKAVVDEVSAKLGNPK